MADESTSETDQTTETTSTTDTSQAGATETETVDWKARAREWEKRSKANSTAADELAALKAKNMSDNEKAVADAEKRGKASAAQEYGRQLAQAKFEAAAAAKGLDLGEAAELIDVARFIDDKGQVDGDAIKAAVAKLAKVTGTKPAGPARSSGEINGAPGGGTPITEEQLSKMTPAQVADAMAKGQLNHLL